MKKKIILFAACLLLSTSAIFAQSKSIPAPVVAEFQTSFKGITDVQWKTAGPLYKASFILDQYPIDAFFSIDGKLTATTRKLSENQLPMILIASMREKQKNAEVTDLFEVLSDRGTEYFFVVDNGKQKKVFTSDGEDWIRYFPSDVNANILVPEE
jgi:hypothetical protein